MQDGVDIGARGTPCGHDSDNQASKQNGGEREQVHAGVGLKIELDGQAGAEG